MGAGNLIRHRSYDLSRQENNGNFKSYITDNAIKNIKNHLLKKEDEIQKFLARGLIFSEDKLKSLDRENNEELFIAACVTGLNDQDDLINLKHFVEGFNFS